MFDRFTNFLVFLLLGSWLWLLHVLELLEQIVTKAVHHYWNDWYLLVVKFLGYFIRFITLFELWELFELLLNDHLDDQTTNKPVLLEPLLELRAGHVDFGRSDILLNISAILIQKHFVLLLNDVVNLLEAIKFDCLTAHEGNHGILRKVLSG